MWNVSAGLFREFAGEGMIVTLFLLAVIWLWVTEKRKEIKIVFVYMPVTVLAIFLFPVTAKIMDAVLGEEIYYRFMWLWPIVPTIAYATVQLWRAVKEQSRILVVVVISLIIILSGKLMYTNENYSIAENQYHVPQAVVDICDDIRIDGREIMWCSDPAFWGKSSPVLFPAIGNVKNNETEIYGRKIKLTKHGFARDNEFKLLNSTKRGDSV